MNFGLAIPQEGDVPDLLAEAALVRQACNEPALFAPLYRRYRDRIYWYVRARVHSDEDAADLTQQVFLQALDRLPQFRERKGTFAAWLFGIARHAAVSSHRRPRTATWDYLPEAEHATAREATEVDALRRESITRVTRLVGSLPAAKRELIILRFVAGLTIPEIASVIGKSAEATRKDLKRILHTLKEQYDDPIP
jgi:RNA polymerase sigma-70 factor (ECF subfamily)